MALRSWGRVCMHLLGPARSNYRVMNDARALRAAGYQVTIVDVIARCDQQLTAEWVDGIYIQHVCAPGWFVPAHFKPWFLVKFCVLMIRCFVRLLGVRADIYHAHVEHAFLATYLVARLRKKGLIFDTPELTMFGPAIQRWPRLRWLAIHCIRWLSRSCDSYITGSPRYVPVLSRLYGTARVLLLRHIPPHHESIRNTRLQQKLGLPAHMRIALYQGNLQADRGLDLLVRAVPYLAPDITIVLLGDGYDATALELAALIQREQLGERIKLLPAVPYAELLDWTSSADLGLLLLPPTHSLSIRYCLPNKFFEYLMAGLPILSARLDAISDMIHRYHVGHVLDELTPASVGQAINTLLADRDLWQTMHANALAAIAHGLTWEEEATKLINLYQAIGFKYTGVYFNLPPPP
ncbi:glycosyltransferase [Dictyobacter formicarum]|uniref:Glycosyl transferase n=1 Tax=Dictyobacter formicarum TaxID=2778368 RepID=A0ABQ3VGD3_9CHLR|nr:glycosyltransferase [Dictyobacter formicarum]GHO84840.1 glycosyl transferase [Dictyobacter formicarum]